jgi:hypothetical protein
VTEVYRVGYLERLPLGTPYPSIVVHVSGLLARLPGAELVIDFTGVGRPVFDMFRFSGITPIGVLITSGAAETGVGQIHSVPKLNLVSRLQALLHEEKLKIHKDLTEAETLVRELQDFRCDYTAAGYLTFNARSGRHDDLVLALGVAVWRASDGGMKNAGLFRYYQRLAGAVAPRDVIGLDLGQSRDPTAIAIVRRVEDRRGPAIPEVGIRSLQPPPEVMADDRTEWRRRYDDMNVRDTPVHPDCGGGAIEYMNGPKAKPEYARGSVEWQRQQERKNTA